MPVVITQPEFWLEHMDELVDGLRIAATMPDEPHLFDTGDSVALERPGWWAEHPSELRAALREAVVLEASAQRWLDIDAAMKQAYERPEPSVRDLLRDAQPPDHPEDRGHGR